MLVALVTLPVENLIMNGINRNGLVMFLAANLLTGCVNLSMKTIYASDATAFTILTFYMFLISLVAVALHKYQITLKFW